MSNNPIPGMTLQLGMFNDLIDEYGAQNVELAMICIVRATDPKGKAIMIDPTHERVSAVLEAVYANPS